MHLSYEKLGLDHPMHGKADYIVMDGMMPVCYKTQDGYLPIAGETPAPTASESATAKAEADTKPLYVLSFKVNGEPEEMTFKSKKKLDKTVALFKEKAYISDLETTEFQVVA
ncbi:MAG: hypothetical protein R3219_07595 [Hydrogenovibrio sp.]|nr:hypothetical protein [Hydrogenovibrio sp.]